jgi:glycosyltransferase involved in cell wall biosynthesis
MSPEVSAVIPTRNRVSLVCRAVQSVLKQTYQNVEAIVVVDGPDPETVTALEALADARVRIIALEENVGGAEARNVGARVAAGKWIALLDDDDEWLPEKIERQLAIAQSFTGRRTLVACQYLDQMGDVELVRPRGFPQPGQRISDFLYSDVSWLGGMDGFPQTSTWLLSKEFLTEVPFRMGLKRNQDTDWLLRALRLPDVKLGLVREPLSIFHNEPKRKRITQDQDWQDCRTWALDHREIFTGQALSSYLIIMCVNHAAQNGSNWKTLKSLFRDCRTYGAMNLKILWLFALYGVLYPRLRRLITPGLRKKLVYYGSMVNILKRSAIKPREGSGEAFSPRVL